MKQLQQIMTQNKAEIERVRKKAIKRVKKSATESDKE